MLLADEGSFLTNGQMLLAGAADVGPGEGLSEAFL